MQLSEQHLQQVQVALKHHSQQPRHLTHNHFHLEKTLGLKHQEWLSQINETNELSGTKSMFVDLKLSTSNANISPVIDLDRASINLIANRINNIDSSSDVYPTTDFNASTEPDGDNNVAIYLTRGIALENPATSIRVFFAGF